MTKSARSNSAVWDSFWARDRPLNEVYPSSPTVLQTLTSRFDLPGMRVLEVGAGSGRDSVELVRCGADVTVLDRSTNGLRIVSQLRDVSGLSKLRLVQGNALCCPFPDESFDLVFHQGLLEHFEEPLPLLRENLRVLRPGGACLCDVPQTFHPYTVLKKILIALDRWFAGWETQYTMRELRAVLVEAGFVVEHTYGDWMRPCLGYRVVRELARHVGIKAPMYPLQETAYQRWKDAVLDRLRAVPGASYTQLTIGVVARKP